MRSWLSPAVVIASLCCSPRARAQDQTADLEPGESALETYELNALQLIHVGARDDEGSWRPARGKYRRAMSYEEFYRAVGRPDLAKAHAARQGLSNMLFYTGWAVMLAGGVVFFVGFEEGEPSTTSWVGVGMVGGGLGFTLAGAMLDVVKLNERDAEQLSLAHNDALRRRLGLGAVPSSSRRTIPRVQLALAPGLEKKSAFVGLVGKF